MTLVPIFVIAIKVNLKNWTNISGESMLNLAKALINFQKNCPTIEKNKTARVKMKEGGEYSFDYADLSQIMDKCRKPLADNGLAIIQLLSTNEQRIVLTTQLIHESGELLTSDFSFLGNSKPQENASAITYYKRYAICAMLGIAAEEDDDANSVNDKVKSHEVVTKKPSEKQINLIKMLAKETSTTITEAQLEGLTIEAASKWIEKLNQIKAAKK